MITEPEAPPHAWRTSGLYQWSAWADGRERLAVKGQDFDCNAESFAQAARSWGERNGYDTSVTRRGDRVWFTFAGDPAAKPRPEEVLAAFLNPDRGYLLPEENAFTSRAGIVDAYDYCVRMGDAPAVSPRVLHAAVRSMYRPARRAGVVGYAGVRT